MASLRTALPGAVFFVLWLSACAGPGGGPGGSRQAVDLWAGERGFRPLAVGSAGIDLHALLRVRGERGGLLSIYIEGDGAPWRNPFVPPRDPTPPRALPLLLADADEAPAVAYLARPCQYLDGERLSRCPVDYWSSRRFAPEPLAAMAAAVSRLKAEAGASRLRLVGYSGGGVVAVLLAARRDDVAELVTVAAPLALSSWLSLHDLAPLAGSVDPLSLPVSSPVAAVHFAGADDRVVPAAVVARYVAVHGGRLVVVDGFDHDCCWQRDWQLRLPGEPPRPEDNK